MATVEKITISLPQDLFGRLEERRKATGSTRSATVAELCWRGWQAYELEAREEQYTAAYAAMPETEEELAWAAAAAEAIFANREPWECNNRETVPETREAG
ncbi:MAG: ribbon-helix-helix protein, CopG family [Acidimicrobiales bacterium]